MSYWQHWKYKHLTFFFISIIFVAFLTRLELFHQTLIHLGNYGYIGAFFAGILFVSTYTVSIGALLLLILAEYLNPIEIALIAGIGAVLGDYTIFRLVKDNLVDELADIYNKFGGKHLSHLLHTRYFSWTLPVIGALIIASPLPDEMGVGLMGISRMSTYKFLILSFILNSIGIFIVVSASVLVKP
ncbi:MAG: hypothetical protein UT63_C0012G0020 [Candidatus Gottesmanbacteria bacterium GW2011_GWC2_39_8]|uniref:Uncharacterized protein n=1 Tax=Candidatus Gottesmanbacteria bacterium GW2011_GWC2_39_8 TaxID=1618450 RepID=A0A0G0Q8U4_9BACT|nr:MAG: hypothetical protein UT63_C0012G0020 [Candidatus Gottesmanbacteria bacterium GW2011_GWC2_39_8]